MARYSNPEEAYQAALEQIEEARKNEATELSLYNFGLETLPPEISQLPSLSFLNLKSNWITTLPQHFNQLFNLKRLDLWGNRITEIPKSITQLSNLTSINLSENQIVEIPHHIAQLTNLTTLELSGNRITEIPQHIAQLKNLTTLELSGNQIVEIPHHIAQLTNLITLELSGNQITEIPQYIAQLKNLTNLVLSFNQISEIPQHLTKLTELTTLHLGGNQIAKIPSHIVQLTILTHLSLNENQIVEIPTYITQLSNLSDLDLSENQIVEIPAHISQLSNLSTLYLSGNQIVEIPAHIAQLSNLSILSLSGNQIIEIPKYITQLSKLNYLYLNGNQISEIPKYFAQLSKLIELTLNGNQISEIPKYLAQLNNLEYLDLRNNPDLPIPPEILQDPDNPQAILDYIASLQVPTVEARRLNEAKVIVVGQGSVGKTSLVNRLVHGTYHKDEEKTPGVNITDWVVTDGADEIEVHLWDFGGQEIMHATHQFFLTRRALYLLVLDCRQSEEENRLDYWLEIIRTFGEASPVIVIGNKVDQHPLELDITGLKNKYPNIVEILPTSAREGTNLDALRELVKTQIPLLENVKDELPGAWFNIKETLEEMSAPHITYSDYQQMCREEGLENEETQERVLQFLHDLGIVFSFPEEGSVSLGYTRVLNPNWVTRGVYRILNDAELNREKGGIFGWPDLRRVLTAPNYPEDMHRAFIMDLMQKFERAFSYRHGRWERFLVPDLLSKNEVDTGQWDDALHFEYHYQIYYPSIISRIMVRHSDDILRHLTWRTGAVFRKDGNEALVRADRGAAKLQIAVRGDSFSRREYLAVLRNDIDRINTSLNIPVKQYIPVSGHPEILADYEHVKNLAKMGKENYVPPGLMEDIPIKDLLGAYQSEQDRQAERDKDLRDGIERIEKKVEEIQAASKTPESSETQKATTASKWVWQFILLVLGAAFLMWLSSVLEVEPYVLIIEIGLVIALAVFLLTQQDKMRGEEAAGIYGKLADWIAKINPFFKTAPPPDTPVESEKLSGDNHAEDIER